ncbi:MAG: acetylesterase [Butyrivibrio sp.]|nr:acetylesterase [Butyrivibrio sp.]
MALLQVNYLSKALFRTVPLNVILPADKIDDRSFSYAMKPGDKFKTLYLLHGLLGNYTDWVSGTRIQRWAEEKNLAVVMPSGDNAFYLNSSAAGNDYSTFIGKELVEVTRNMFPLSERREDTFIAGLSMGGYGAIRNGLVYSETFSHVIGLSSAVHILEKDPDFFDAEEGLFAGVERGVFGDIRKAAATDANPKLAFEGLLEKNRKLPRLYMSCGTEDELYKANTDLRDYFISKGADVTWDEEKGGHDWDFWDSQIKKVIDWLPLEEADNGLGSGNVKKN